MSVPFLTSSCHGATNRDELLADSPMIPLDLQAHDALSLVSSAPHVTLPPILLWRLPPPTPPPFLLRVLFYLFISSGYLIIVLLIFSFYFFVEQCIIGERELIRSKFFDLPFIYCILGVMSDEPI